jgi:hypothetical protein
MNLPESYTFGDTLDAILLSLLENLKEIHDCNIVHRDREYCACKKFETLYIKVVHLSPFYNHYSCSSIALLNNFSKTGQPPMCQ